MSLPISLERLTLRYGERNALSTISLSVNRGEVLALLGPSGSGKSTLLRIILGLIAPDTGTVMLNGQLASRDGRILQPPEARNLAVVFQDLALWPHLTVRGNLAFGLEAKRVARLQREERIAEILRRVGLSAAQSRHPGELSGGERQRVAIARALVLEPSAVLFDEPLSNLDAGLRRELLIFLRQLLRERGATAIYVTHDLREAAALGDRIAVIEEGRIVQLGNLEEIRLRPATEFVKALVADLTWSGTSGAGD